MTTTPDSRIRADFGLDSPRRDPLSIPKSQTEIARNDFLNARYTRAVQKFSQEHPMSDPIDTSTTATPDTSTTAGKIAVMQAYERGERIESTPRNPRDHAYGLWAPVRGAAWNWGLQDYRIAPPAPRSALEAARDRACMVPPTGGDADNSVRDLLKQIDNSQRIHVIGERPIYTETGQSVTPGLYRLVRDGA